jgi:hypothetical protein
MTFDIAIEARNANGIMQIASLAEATEISLANEAPAQALTIRWSGHHVQRGIWETVAQIAGQIDPLGFSVGVVANILSSFLWHKFGPRPSMPGPEGRDRKGPPDAPPHTTITLVGDGHRTQIIMTGLDQARLEHLLRDALSHESDGEPG